MLTVNSMKFDVSPAVVGINVAMKMVAESGRNINDATIKLAKSKPNLLVEVSIILNYKNSYDDSLYILARVMQSNAGSNVR